MAEDVGSPDQEWENGWEGHQRAQRLRLARLPMVEKLAWLEEAHRVVLHLEAQRRAMVARQLEQGPR